MTTQINTKTWTSDAHLTALLVSSILISLFLFYIDEGYYNFKWMANIGSWIVFFVYVAVFFSSQFLVSKSFFKKKNGLNKTILSIIGGGISLTIIILVIGMSHTF